MRKTIARVVVASYFPIISVVKSASVSSKIPF